MLEPSKGEWVMVTGATGGIGRALVASLVTKGQNVIAAARDISRISVEKGPGRIVGVQFDLEQPSTFAAVANDVARIVGDTGLSALVNVAGIIVEGPIEAIPPSELRRQLDVNVIGPFALAQALLPQLKKERSKVVNIGSISAHLTVPFYGPIAASKVALASLSDAMRLEWAQYAIDVILIEPGAMKTGIFATSRAARNAYLSVLPELEQHYRPALAAMESAFDKAGADDPKVVVEAVMNALYRSTPKPRVVVGKGTGALRLLSHLPIRLRDRLVKHALGLNKALKSIK